MKRAAGPLARVLRRRAEYDVRRARWDDWRHRNAEEDPDDCANLVLSAERKLARGDFARYLGELRQCGPLRESVDRYSNIIGKDYNTKLSGVVLAACLFNYACIRALKPTTVVETGCATGWTSALILLALHNNQHGHLQSIDLRPVSGERSMDWTLPDHLEPGFLVPDQYRDRWTLTLGDARSELPKLLERVDGVGVFYHDSDHSYEHMMWEYTTVWPKLAADGLLISDDIGWNTAAWDFATALRRLVAIYALNPNFGAISKGGAPCA